MHIMGYVLFHTIEYNYIDSYRSSHTITKVKLDLYYAMFVGIH